MKGSSRPVSIQTQLLLGAGIILALASIIAVVGYATLRQLQTEIQTTLQEASQIRESSLLIENEFLTTRQDEAAFLSRWPSLGYEAAFEQYVVPGTSQLEVAGMELDRIGRLVQVAHDPDLRSLTAEVDEMGPLLDEYKTAFLTTVAHVEQRTRGGGLEKTMDSEMSLLEEAVTPLPQADLLTLVLQLRANEQAYLNTGRQEYADNVRILVDRFITLVEDSSEADLTPVSPGGGETTASTLTSHAETYLSLFTRVVNLDRNIQVNTTLFREVTTDIDDITASIRQKSESGLTQAQGGLQRVGQRSTVALIAATALALGLGVMVALLLARRIAGPLGQLSRAAQRMGEGDLSPSAVAGPTEVVTLGGALNTMAGQLRGMIGSLEQRVAERTRGLEAAAQVSQATTSVLDPEELLRRVVELVRERFDLYYAGLFLVQEEAAEQQAAVRERREWAVLRAGTGEAGQQMLAGGHRLAAGGESMIGWCITHGQARIALDVGHEAVRFDNPLLPETRSEMALPLRSRGRVIGAMTVQSKAEAAFDEADVAVMQTMADQVAVAIDNAHLFAETEAALKEMEAVHRSYLRETWSEYLRVAETTGYDTAGLGTVSRLEIERAMAGRGTTVVDTPPPGQALGQGEAGLHSALVAPIMLRDEVIGVLGIHDQAGAGPPRKWTEDEMRMVEGVANRLASAAENLRLLEDTRRRAARERLAREITDRIRAAVSVEDAVQRAMQGLSRALGASEVAAQIGAEGGDGHE